MYAFCLKLLGWWCMKQIRWDDFLLGILLQCGFFVRSSQSMSSLITSLLGIMGNIGWLQQLSLLTTVFIVKHHISSERGTEKKQTVQSVWYPFFTHGNGGRFQKTAICPGLSFLGGRWWESTNPTIFSRILPWVTLAMKHHQKSNEKNKGP